MRRQRNSHGDADQLASASPLPCHESARSRELVRHTFAERGGERYAAIAYAACGPARRTRPTERKSHAERIAMQIAANRAAADDPWRIWRPETGSRNGSEPTAMHAFSRNVMMAPAMTEHRQIQTRLIPRQTADGLRNEHRVERRHRADSSIGVKRKTRNEPVGRIAVGLCVRAVIGSRRSRRRFEVRHSHRQDARPRLGRSTFRCDARLCFRTLVGRFRTRGCCCTDSRRMAAFASGVRVFIIGRSSMPGG